MDWWTVGVAAWVGLVALVTTTQGIRSDLEETKHLLRSYQDMCRRDSTEFKKLMDEIGDMIRSGVVVDPETNRASAYAIHDGQTHWWDISDECGVHETSVCAAQAATMGLEQKFNAEGRCDNTPDVHPRWEGLCASHAEAMDNIG